MALGVPEAASIGQIWVVNALNQALCRLFESKCKMGTFCISHAFRRNAECPHFVLVAEREGFEPSKGYKPLLVFKTSAFNRSATSPARAFAPRIVLANEPKHNISV